MDVSAFIMSGGEGKSGGAVEAGLYRGGVVVHPRPASIMTLNVLFATVPHRMNDLFIWAKLIFKVAS